VLAGAEKVSRQRTAAGNLRCVGYGCAASVATVVTEVISVELSLHELLSILPFPAIDLE
jgi:hypothetical protein